MQRLSFVTGNDEKFQIADAVCLPLGVSLVQQKIHIDEIQSEDSQYVAQDKAQRAFAVLKQPLVVSDDSWNIPGLRGFPGPYMKSIHHWFTSQDFLNLTRTLPDRRIILTQMLVYQNHETSHVVRHEYVGTLLTEARGTYGGPLEKILTMPGDNGLSVAEAYDRGTVRAERDIASGWRELVAWLQGVVS